VTAGARDNCCQRFILHLSVTSLLLISVNSCRLQIHGHHIGLRNGHIISNEPCVLMPRDMRVETVCEILSLYLGKELNGYLGSFDA
jgi:hypothetical protein